MVKNINRNWKSFFLIISLNIFIVSLLFVIFPYKPKIDYSTIVLSDDNTLIHSFLTPDDKWRMFTTLDEITPTLKKAIIFKEDRFFYYHFGVNPI